MILRGKGGIQYNLEPTPFAQGGEGQIFNINGHPNKVAKLYKAGKITPDHERKLLKMVSTPPEQDVLDQIAWPLDVLYDNNKFVGFVMRKFKLNEDLNVIYEYGSSAKYPEMPWGNKIKIAKNLCVVLNAVHEAGHVCGDLNPKNISVDPNTGHITFVDTDSYHITDGNNTYRCNVGMPEYLPVEVQKKMNNGLSNAALPTFSQATDNFALAVHIFQLLMNGVHPFACAVIPSQDSVPIPDTSDSILKGECPFFKNVPGKQIPKFAPPADILPQEIKKLFLLAFVEGHASPAARPSAETWYYALERLEQSLKKCKDVGHHEYYNSLKDCPWCEADKRFSGALSSAKSKGLKQSNFTPPVAPPTLYRNPTYRPSSASVSSTRGSNVPTYVGANNYGSATNQKKGNFTKKLIGGIVAVVLIAALIGFAIWPMLIYPNLPNEDFNTPDIVQSYCYSTDKEDVIFTITECTANGQVKATWEFINNGKYGKINLTGKIVEKKNNGDVVIEWTSNSVEMLPDGVTWVDEKTAAISKKWTVLKTDDLTLTAGVNEEYTIKTADDFKKLSGSSATFYLKNDIDLTGLNWTPIEEFSGMLLGNGYSIKNLKIESSASNVGFFSTLEGIVQNVKFEHVEINVTGYQENVGALCGVLHGNVMNVTIDGSITASSSNNVGGVAGYVEKNTDSVTFSNLESKATISGADYVGGIFGKLYNRYNSSYATTQLSGFINSGAITGKNNVGGLIGDCTAKTLLPISEFNNTGSVTGAENVGGTVGYAYGYSNDDASYIMNSSCAAAVSGEAYVGCIVGKAEGVLINSCTNAGSTLTATKYVTVDGSKYACVGGFAGMANGANDCVNEVTINYSAGGSYVGGIIGYVERNTDSVTLSNLENKAAISGADYVGGIFGKLYNRYNSSYATTQLSGFINSGAITGKNNVGGLIGDCTAKTLLPISEFNNTGSVTGAENVGGTVGYAYGYSNDDASYIMNSSCAAAVSGEAYVGCIVGKAEGVLINSCTNAGSTLTATKYVTVDGSKYACVGGFAGMANGANDCVNEVTINYSAGGSYVGGIIGYVERNTDSVTLSNLENKAAISGADYVGGIFGKLYNRYNSSYATTQLSGFINNGAITGKNNVGGLIGDCTAKTELYIIDFVNGGKVSGSSTIGGIIGYCYGYKGSYIQDSSTTSGSMCGKAENVTIN